MQHQILRVLAMVAGLVLAASAPLVAQDRELGWADQAEFTFVMSAGNATASTFGLKNVLDRIWESSSFNLSAGGVRTFAALKTGEASGTAGNFTPVKNEDVTAENFYVRSRYDRTISDAAFVFGGAGWDRNTFAGIDSRYSFVGGTGRTWFEEDAKHFKTDIGVTYTIQDNVVGGSDSFAGLRGTWDYFNTLTETTTFGSALIVDENLSTTEDFRADFTNYVSVTMSERMALKASLQLLFDNLPSLEEFTLISDQSTVSQSLDKLDSIFTVALVVNVR